VKLAKSPSLLPQRETLKSCNADALLSFGLQPQSLAITFDEGLRAVFTPFREHQQRFGDRKLVRAAIFVPNRLLLAAHRLQLRLPPPWPLHVADSFQQPQLGSRLPRPALAPPWRMIWVVDR
jgi:hypothetical protein